jgi:hypothetical protein
MTDRRTTTKEGRRRTTEEGVNRLPRENVSEELSDFFAYAGGMGLDWRFGELAEGLACYERGEFFETHEHWELVWLKLAEPEKSFLQALIQVAAAMHHGRAGNARGMASLMGRALRRLELCPEEFGGIAVARLRDEIRRCANGVQRCDASEVSAPTISVIATCPANGSVDSVGESAPES